MSKRSTGEFESRNGSRRGRVEYSRTESERPSVAVANALATYSDEDVTATSSQLYDYVDPEALDALFADRYDGASRSDGVVRFRVDDLTVVVGPATVEVYE